MKYRFLTVAVLAGGIGMNMHAAEPADSGSKMPGVKVVHAEVVNDTVPNAMVPTGVVRVGAKDLLAVFADKGDASPGTKGYLVRSSDLGKTWSPEIERVFTAEAPNVGLGITLTSLPGGDLLLMESVSTHQSDDRSWDAVFKGRSIAVNLYRSENGGKSFQPAGSLDGAEAAVLGVMGTVLTIPNGDVLLPAYQYPGHGAPRKDALYGSGFFRSRDGGKTWGPFERAFQDPVPGEEKKLSFNESAYTVRPDGSLVAFARIDSQRREGSTSKQWQTTQNYMWVVESDDNGETWSDPVETNIGGIFPKILRLRGNRYLMVCGDRHANPTRKVRFFTSRDGRNFEPAGFAPYSRTEGSCVSTATGGAQDLVAISDNEVYCVYYAADPEVDSLHQTYIEGCLLRVE